MAGLFSGELNLVSTVFRVTNISEKLNNPTSSSVSELDYFDNTRSTILEQHGYRIGRQIGHGSYAKVKLAYSETLNTSVAIKVISKFRTPKDYIQNFLPRELEVIKGLQHPNLIRFFQSIETTHRVFIVMEYAERGSLLDLIHRERKLDEDVARNYFKQLLGALEYIHEKGIVHR